MADTTFDPDAYLAQKTQGMAQAQGGQPQAFDPDAYLAQKTGSQITTAPGQAQTALEHGANTAAIGYLPQLQALASKPIYGALNAVTGQDVEPDSYVDERDRNAQRLSDEEKANPKTALAGSVGGALAGAAATPEVKALGMLGKGIAGGIARGAAYGTAQGALSNPGDTKGVVDPLQLQDREKNAVSGAETGGVMGAAAGGIGGLLSKLSTSPEAAQSFANAKAVKASGGMLKDFRSLSDRGQIDPIGKFALDNGIVKAGDTVDSIAEKAASVNKDAGNRLQDIYSQANSEALKTASPEQLQKMDEVGFNPVRDRSQVLSQIKDSLGDDVDKTSAVKSVSNYLDQLTEDYGNQTLSPKQAQQVKTAMDEKINYSRNPLSSEPAAEKGFSQARGLISQRIDQGIDAVGQASGDAGLLSKLKQANQDYGYSAQLKNMAEDRMSRDNSNRQFGLTDTIAGGAGAGVGGMIGHAIAGPIGGAEGAAAGALAGGAINKLSRTYGPAIQSDVANRAAPILENTVAPAAQAAQSVYNPDIVTRAGTETGLLRKKK